MFTSGFTTDRMTMCYLNSLSLNEKWGKHDSMDIFGFSATHKEQPPALGKMPTVPEVGGQIATEGWEQRLWDISVAT